MNPEIVPLKLSPIQTAPSYGLLSRYLSGEPALTDRLGGPPADIGAVREALARSRARSYHRDVLVERLLQLNTRLGASPSTLDNIQALGDESCFVVATGQQPGLLTGPLYTLWKACTSIALARQLTRELGTRFVPLFWVASDDHDLGEIEGCFVVNDAAEVQRLRVPLGPVGSPSARLHLDESAHAVFDRFLAAVPGGRFDEQLAALAAPRPGERWPEWFGRILLALFADSGLILFEPSQAVDLLEPILREELKDPARAPRALAAGQQALSALGLDAQLPTDLPSCVFAVKQGRRQRFDPDVDAVDSPEPGSLSADAGLRAAVQSLVLPAPVVVAGPGEIAYWLQLTELFASLGAPRPVLFPRLRATMIEQRVRRALATLALESDQLFSTYEELRSVLPGVDPDREQRLRTDSDRAYTACLEFTHRLKSAGAPNPKALLKLEQNYRSSLDKLVRQTLEQAQRESGVSERQARLIAASGRPKNQLQERVLCGLPFIARHGPDLFHRIAERIDPFCFEHLLIEPDSGSVEHG